MNYLAHLYLSGTDENLIIGNMAGDFIRQRDVATCSEEIQVGIQLHRTIDGYTDDHPIFRKGLERLRPNHGKYAAVVLDILYDYLLAKSWSRYHNITLPSFAKFNYEIFNRRKEDLPGKLKHKIDSMMAHNFIESYASKEKVEYILNGMNKRTKFPSKFDKAMDDYMKDQELFDTEFHLFFGQMHAFVQQKFGLTLPHLVS